MIDPLTILSLHATAYGLNIPFMGASARRDRCHTCQAQIPPGRPGRKCKKCRSDGKENHPISSQETYRD